MRITKRFSGTSCLGRKIYVNDCMKISAEDLEKAKKEIDEMRIKFKNKLDDIQREIQKKITKEDLSNHVVSTPAIDAMLKGNSFWNFLPSSSPLPNSSSASNLAALYTKNSKKSTEDLLTCGNNGIITEGKNELSSNVTQCSIVCDLSNSMDNINNFFNELNPEPCQFICSSLQMPSKRGANYSSEDDFHPDKILRLCESFGSGLDLTDLVGFDSDMVLQSIGTYPSSLSF